MLNNVVGVPSDGVLALALSHNGIHDIVDVLTLRDKDIAMIDTGDPTKPMLRGNRAGLRVLKAFIHQIGPGVDFLAITHADYQEFKYDYSVGNITSTPTPPQKGPFVKSDATKFKKGIKRDKSHYPKLKNEKQWDSWQLATLATARTHDCEDVFDH